MSVRSYGADPRTPGIATRGETVPTVPPAETAADAVAVSALLERGRTLATPVLREAVDRLAPPMDTVAAYHFGWIDAEVKDFFVTRERTATFAPTPGVGRLRPGARTKAPGLYLAGAWTATGWPATMESAVRSGVSAADAALAALGRPRPRRLFEFEEAA